MQRAPWATPSALTLRPLRTVTDLKLAPGGWTGATAMGANGLWFNSRDPDGTQHYDVRTGATARQPQGALTGEPLPIAGGAVVFHVVEPSSLAIQKEDGTLIRLVTPTPPQIVTYVRLDRSTEPPTLVWVESERGGKFYTNATLWTAPLAAREADLVRRKVAKLDDAEGTGGGWGVANRGHFLSRIGKRTALLTRLSDGMGWRIDAEEGDGFNAPMWVDDATVIIKTGAYDAKFGVGRPTGILRLDRSSLGAPTVPSGL